MKAPIDYFYLGRADGLANKPKNKRLKGDNAAAYRNGYAEGTKDRSKPKK